MRIAFVYDAVYPWSTGGVEKRVWEIARRLSDDHEVHWYGLKYWDGPTTIAREGVHIHGVHEAPELYVEGRRSISEAITFAAYLAPHLRGEEFDIVDFQEFPYFPAFTCKIHELVTGSPLVLTWHEVWGDYWYEYLGKKGIFGKGIEKVVSKLTDRHVAVSPLTKSQLCDLGVEQSTYIPNGIDLDSIRDVEPVNHDVDILFVGRLIEQKNVDLLLRALGHLRDNGSDATCYILGDGPERHALEELVEQLDLGDRVEFSDPVETHDEVLALMQAANVFGFPSRREGFGMTALEALACGTPVVTLEHEQNAATHLVEEGVSGTIVDKSPADLAEGIERAREFDEADCIEAAAEYDWENLVEQTETFYEEVATNSS